MKIELETVKENEDGSVDVVVHLSDDAKDYLIRYAIIACLTDAIEAGKIATPTGEE
jgi:hypothetical protein